MHYRVFGLLFEITAKNVIYIFFFVPLFEIKNYRFKSECEDQMKVELASEKCF